MSAWNPLRLPVPITLGRTVHSSCWFLLNYPQRGEERVPGKSTEELEWKCSFGRSSGPELLTRGAAPLMPLGALWQETYFICASASMALTSKLKQFFQVPHEFLHISFVYLPSPVLAVGGCWLPRKTTQASPRQGEPGAPGKFRAGLCTQPRDHLLHTQRDRLRVKTMRCLNCIPAESVEKQIPLQRDSIGDSLFGPPYCFG